MTERTLRVLSYNVRSLRDDDDAVTRVIRAVDPDVVLVQEAPRMLRWRARCASLARRSGLVVVTGGRPAGSNLVLSALRVDVVSTVDWLLEPAPRLHRRGAAAALLERSGVRFAVAGTHLDLDADWRLRHAAELRRRLAAWVPPGTPLVVAGDVNERPGEPAWGVLAEGLQDTYAAAGSGPGETFSATRPRRRIDGIFAAPQLPVRACRVLDGPDVERASDHRPVLAELELPPG